MSFQRIPYAPNPEPVIRDVVTGTVLPWKVLRVDVDRTLNTLGFAGRSPLGVRVKIVGSVKPFRTPVRLDPYGIVLVCMGCTPLDIDGTSIVTLREHRPSLLSSLPLRKTKNRIRYKHVGVDRFAVHDNRGPVLGYVVRTARGYEIEGHGRTSDTMRGVLKHFRDVDRLEAAQRFIEQMKRDGVVSGLIEHLTRDKRK